MNPFVSQSERDIRDAVVARARQLWPGARIIHELNVEHGSTRADVAAVTPDQLILFEIKSERDKLHRLSAQLRSFGPVAHAVIVAAHEKWCGGSTLPNGDVGPIIGFAGHGELWRYPEPEGKFGLRYWHEPHTFHRPWAHRMLRLLWTDELRHVAAESGVKTTGTTPGYKLADQLALHLPGRDVELAVCRALRQRQFAEADAPVEVAA